MPFPILAFYAIAAGAQLLGTVVGGAMQSSENKRARNEAREIAKVQRQDYLTEQTRQNKLSLGRSKLADKEMGWNKNVVMQEKQQAEDTQSYLLNKGNQEFLSGVGQRSFGAGVEDITRKNRLIAGA